MMALEGIDRINDIINEFLEPFELTAEPGTDFCYYFLEDKIYYALAVGNTSAKLFMENAEARFPDAHADVFLWSLLHEIGHSETLDDLEDDEEVRCMEIKRELSKHTDWSITRRHEIYFACPDEMAATDWAGEYIMNHVDELSIFWSNLQAAIQDFYRLNEVE